MSNQRDLKAFVRYDGSGRVVAGSLVLRKNKPKVGRWKEIQAYECCNYVPTTTTTTTTSLGAPGNYIANVYSISDGICSGPLVFNVPITSSTNVVVGKWYSDSASPTVAIEIVSAGGAGGTGGALINERDTCNI
jgi:hypothetical protein